MYSSYLELEMPQAASTESKTVIYIAGLIDLFGVALFGALYLPIIKPLGGGPLELGYLGGLILLCNF